MAITAHVFTKSQNSIATGILNPNSASFRVILATSATTGLAAAQNTAQFMSDVKSVTGWTEVASSAGGSNYTQNANSTSSGLALVSPTWTQSGLVWTLTTSTNPTWTTAASGFAPAYAVFFDSQPGTDATNPALGWWDLGGATPGTGGPWTVTISGSGLYNNTSS